MLDVSSIERLGIIFGNDDELAILNTVYRFEARHVGSLLYLMMKIWQILE
jgi:hypothetical protein